MESEQIIATLTQISSKILNENFGSKSDIYSEITSRLSELLEQIRHESVVSSNIDNWKINIHMLYNYEPNLSLFIDHTYLILLARLVTYAKFRNGDDATNKQITEIISGEYFVNIGISNLTDDFCNWLLHPAIKEEPIDVLHIFAQELSEFDFSKVDEDIFRGIYEDIIERDERHKSGEYYTPEWLVELILNDVIPRWKQLNSKPFPRILDPACGSGAFLYRAIRILQENGASTEDILENIQGFDINPIAIAIAKTNYLMAISDVIESSSEITIPVYIKDCLKSHADLLDSFWRSEKYDIIIGNPPWVVMRSVNNKDHQDSLKTEALNYGLIDGKDVHLFTQMELATLFFRKAADLYLEKEGIIAFVMPRSVIAGTKHHHNFRKFDNPSIKLIKIVDLENVSPLFNMPSCVLIGLKDGITKYPVPLEDYRGKLINRNSRLDKAMSKLSVIFSDYSPVDAPKESSYYYDKFKVGASIFPRSLYFVDILGCKSSTLNVRTSEEIDQIVKDPWHIILDGNVENDFLYATLLAWEMFPFGYIKLRPVVLPIKEEHNGYELLNLVDLQKNGYKEIADWFSKTSKIWDERKTEKSEERFPSLLDRLDYNNLLAVQNPTKRYVVLYNATGTNLVSCVIDKQDPPYFEINGKHIKPKGFIVDVKTWFFETNDVIEAHYLCSIFNSDILSEMIKPYQPRGLFGARAIHRRPLLFPIPEYNKHDDRHIRLTKISEKCHGNIKNISFINDKRARSETRKVLRNEIVIINEIVSQIIGSGMEN